MEWLNVFKAIIYGIVEGVTEWLPISSTGHLIILERLLPFSHSDSAHGAAFFSLFLVVIQLGAILAVLVTFWQDLCPLKRRGTLLAAGKSGGSVKPLGAKWCYSTNVLQLWGKIIVACLPAAIIGLLFDELFERLFYNHLSVALALIVVGVAFIVVENYIHGKKYKVDEIKDVTYVMAFIIGLFQVLAAVFPGVSRSGATIIGALLLGLSRQVATKLTFYLAVPVMAGASLLKVVKYDSSINSAELCTILVGMAVAYLVSEICIKYLMNYVRKHDFVAFAWYRIALGALVLLINLI